MLPPSPRFLLFFLARTLSRSPTLKLTPFSCLQTIITTVKFLQILGRTKSAVEKSLPPKECLPHARSSPLSSCAAPSESSYPSPGCVSVASTTAGRPSYYADSPTGSPNQAPPHAPLFSIRTRIWCTPGMGIRPRSACSRVRRGYPSDKRKPRKYHPLRITVPGRAPPQALGLSTVPGGPPNRNCPSTDSSFSRGVSSREPRHASVPPVCF